MRSVLLALLPVVLAQTILPTTLPSCASQCTTLQNAANGCLPSGGAPVSNAATYQNCFCQSGLLTGMSDANTICPNVCDNADWNTINTWRVEYCSNPVQAAAGGASTTQAAQVQTTMATSASVGTGTATGAAQATQSVSVGGGTSGQGQGSNIGGSPYYPTASAWFATHWNWVVMVIVLAVGLSAIGIIAGVWHRRYTRKRDSAGAGPAMARWAPPTDGDAHNVTIGAFGETRAQVNEKGKMRVS